LSLIQNRLNNVVNDGLENPAPMAQVLSEGSIMRVLGLIPGASGAFSALIVTVAVVGHPAMARPGQPSPNIRVDVSPLRANSLNPTAAWVAEELPGQIVEALARRGAPNTPIAVRVDYVTLGPNLAGTPGPGGASPDNIRGVATIRGVEEPVRALTWYYLNAQDSAIIEESNHRRVSELVQAFAYWIAQDAAR
jgi:hypothetical protein